MWTYLKTKKLTILAILAGLTYAFMIVNTFASEWDDWQISFNERALGAVYNKWGDEIGQKPVESFSFPIRSKNGFASFPDSLVNLVNHQTIKAKYNGVYVLVPRSKPSKPEFSMMGLFLTLLAFLFLIVLIRIPIHFYKLISLIKKEFIFERKSIGLLRWLSLELLVIYFGGMLISYFVQQMNSLSFSFSNYEIQRVSMDPIWLFLGIVVLLIAEIISKGLSIREEQELTI